MSIKLKEAYAFVCVSIFFSGCSTMHGNMSAHKDRIEFANMSNFRIASDAKKKFLSVNGYFGNEVHKEDNQSAINNRFYAGDDEFYLLSFQPSYASSCLIYSLVSGEKVFSSTGDKAESECTQFLENKKLKKVDMAKKKIDDDSYMLYQEHPEKHGYSIGAKVSGAKTKLRTTRVVGEYGLMLVTSGLSGLATGLLPRAIDADINIEIIDDTQNLNRQSQEFKQLEKRSFGEYVDYLGKYKDGYLYAETKKKLVETFFDFNLKGSKLGEQEDFSGRGLITSNSGVCQNMEKYLDIRPKFNIAEAEGLNLTVSLRGTLKRYYRPVALNSQEDPINKDIVLSLNPANRYSTSQSFDYGCVPTSMKIASIGFSLIAKVAGMLGKNVGDGTIPTELKKTAFVIDVLEVN